MRVAIVGAGVAGLVAAYRLASRHEVTVFEALDYPGGHTNTIAVDDPAGPLEVDTGFIVYNEQTYPQFIRLLDELRVASQPTSMGFSVRCDATGWEYAGTSLNGLFAQRRNLVRPRFWRLLSEWLRFSREAERSGGERESECTVGEFLSRHAFSRDFIQKYFLPMGSAIWSCPRERFQEFPIEFILEFYRNHGLLSVTNRPQWRVIRGGSRSYVRPLVASFRNRLRLQTRVLAVQRDGTGVTLELSTGTRERFDRVIFACHADQALRILGRAATEAEREILSAFPYERNVAVLHTDRSVLPRRRRAWASWNYRIPAQDTGRATVTYNMNILQGLRSSTVYCVTLNDEESIDPRRILRRIEYEHPTFSLNRRRMQARHAELLGPHGTFYCGAYWRNGFHEDGVASGITASEALLATEGVALGLRKSG